MIASHRPMPGPQPCLRIAFETPPFARDSGPPLDRSDCRTDAAPAPGEVSGVIFATVPTWDFDPAVGDVHTRTTVPAGTPGNSCAKSEPVRVNAPAERRHSKITLLIRLTVAWRARGAAFLAMQERRTHGPQPTVASLQSRSSYARSTTVPNLRCSLGTTEDSQNPRRLPVVLPHAGSGMSQPQKGKPNGFAARTTSRTIVRPAPQGLGACPDKGTPRSIALLGGRVHDRRDDSKQPSRVDRLPRKVTIQVGAIITVAPGTSGMPSRASSSCTPS